MRDFVEPLHAFDAAVLQRPELRRKRAPAPASPTGQIEGDRRRTARRAWRSEPRASCGRFFTSSATLARSSTPSDSATWKAMPRAMPSSPSPFSSSASGPSSLVTCWASQRSRPALHQLQRRAGELLVGDDADLRRQDVAAGGDAAHRLAEPADQPVVGQHEQPRRARRLADARRAAPRSRRPGPSARRHSACAPPRPQPGGSEVKRNPFSLPDVLAFGAVTSPLEVISASMIAFSRSRRRQDACPAVDKSLGQTHMQGVGQRVLYPTRHALPNARGRATSPSGSR